MRHLKTVLSPNVATLLKIISRLYLARLERCPAIDTSHISAMQTILFCLIAALAGFISPANAQSWLSTDAVVKTERTQARLVAWAPNGIRVGEAVQVGLLLEHAPDWHTYWKNSGESGLPTEIQWQLPAGSTAGPLQWPTPKKFKLGPLGNYGYDGQVLLSSPITVSQVPPGEIWNIKMTANWLACRAECVPEFAELSLALPVASPWVKDRPLFETAQQQWPQDRALNAEMQVINGALELVVANVPAPWVGQSLNAYPEVGNLIVAGSDAQGLWKGSDFLISVPIHPDRDLSPEAVPWVLASADVPHGQPAAAGLRVQANLKGEWPPVQAVELNPALAKALARPPGPEPAASRLSWWSAMALAFLGGILLNLMPCVFPVLAIKVLAIAQSDDRRMHRISGVTYTLGVVASFSALAALLFGLRSGGAAIGWGFQLQEPAVIAGLAILFTLIGLNLIGLFEFNLTASGRWANLRLRHPAMDAMWSGVLATVIASPCTAPFMGAALGYAITQPAVDGIALFAAVGLGMASPYLLLSWVPALSRWLPGPGAWMLHFKQLMSFPMFATVVWLVWVIGQQGGINASAALLMLLLSVAMWLWAWNLTSSRRIIWKWVGSVVLGGAIWVLSPFLTTVATPSASATSWVTWSPQIEQQARADGRRVFVDFTAAWCVTCQVNELGALSDQRVETAFEQGNWLRLRADWTKRDPEISQALNRLQRTGVPTYVVYHPQRDPQVLTELLTVDQILNAITPR